MAPLGENYGPIDYGTPVQVVFEDQEKMQIPIIVEVQWNRRIPLQGEGASSVGFKHTVPKKRETVGGTTRCPEAIGPIMVVAHRGHDNHDSNIPENSLAAVQAALDIGTPIIEIDLKETNDGHWVLMHDRKIGRTTTWLRYRKLYDAKSGSS